MHGAARAGPNSKFAGIGRRNALSIASHRSRCHMIRKASDYSGGYEDPGWTAIVMVENATVFHHYGWLAAPEEE